MTTSSPHSAATGSPDEHAASVSEPATAREIGQQPAVWREVVAASGDREAQVRGFLDPLLARPDLRIVLSGAGTSAFAGEVLAPSLTRVLGRRVDVVATTDVVSSPREVFAEDVPTLLVSLSRSGNSPESVATTRLADQCLHSVHHLVVTCDADGQLAREHASSGTSLVLLMPEAANDRGFAMTSSFTSMLLATWLALAPMAAPSPTSLVDQVAAGAEQVLAASGTITELAGRGYQRVVYLGSGSLAGLARESALKLLELTAGQVVSFYDTPLGFRHGPKAVLRDRTLAVVYLSNDPYTRRYDEDIVAELAESLGKEHVLVIAARPPESLQVGVQVGVQVGGLDDADDALLALPFVVVAQLLALQCSLDRGLTPDNPFPDGEVNRVVQGVTVHPLPR